ncbi:hypothetical protein GO685_01830 [Wolbachia endosymbiont of Madathamugadia hiepei]|uniref:hypothetical protein n=1 Tax=Wolbachia endosymbiont of Madathamugadia hiepei TaxID=1241303 RepID=UPI00158A6A8E|nr:hypothetical protein [Wolbachia endosymbiont of Madathamugadia hiepei]NUX01257.1 hypothetical protein [Wolbachia endosymbiont of Madathamugadia hiepei]
MLETLKKWGTDLRLKVKDLFTSPESQVYVKDLRKVMTYNGKKCQYLKNYDQIVESGEIIEKKDRNGKLVKDEEGNPEYQLVYNGYKFDLALVKKVDNRSYFTIDFLVNPKKNKDVKHYDSYYKPFEFSKIDLEKHLPVFEAQKTENSKYPFELTNSSVLTKEVKNKEGKIQEVVDQEGRNGELLYTSDYKKLSTSFFEVRNQNGNLELDKSLVSVPIVFAAGLAKICAKLLTFIPMKLGEHLVNRQNPIAKFFGYLLFTSAMAVKNLVNMGATVLKAPILLFVADKKKYGDAYWTMRKHQLKECLQETKNDYSVVKEGKRSEPEEKDYPERKIAGTWKELDARRPGIERELEKGLNKSSESIDKSGKPGKNLEEKLQDKDKQDNKNQERNTSHTDREKRRRNSHKGKEFNHTRTN